MGRRRKEEKTAGEEQKANSNTGELKSLIIRPHMYYNTDTYWLLPELHPVEVQKQATQ